MIYKYSQFITEDFNDDFKSKYIKLFNNSDEDIKNELEVLFKKIDNETDQLKTVNVFDDFLSSNQNTLKMKISESVNQDSINKLLSDNLKSIYFAIKSIQIKLNSDDFIDIFEQLKDENLKNLMEMKADKFSDAVPVYVKDYMIPQIKKMSNIQSVQEMNIFEAEIVQPSVVQPNVSQSQVQTEIPAENNNKQLETYKTKSNEWFDYIYGMVWNKVKNIKTQLNSNKQILNNIDQVSNLMKNSDNEEAKKQLLNKIISLSKEQLNKLGDILKLNMNEIGDF